MASDRTLLRRRVRRTETWTSLWPRQRTLMAWTTALLVRHETSHQPERFFAQWKSALERDEPFLLVFIEPAEGGDVVAIAEHDARLAGRGLRGQTTDEGEHQTRNEGLQ